MSSSPPSTFSSAPPSHTIPMTESANFDTSVGVEVKYIDRRDAAHNLWAEEEIQTLYTDWPHDFKDPVSQHLDSLTDRIRMQCNFLASELSSERQVYGIKAALYDGSPVVIVVIEDTEPLPAASNDQKFFDVHWFYGEFQWTSNINYVLPPLPPSNVGHAGTMITLIPPPTSPELVPSTLTAESTSSSALLSTTPTNTPVTTFTAGLFLRDVYNPLQNFVLSVGHPFTPRMFPLSVTEDISLKVGWPSIPPQVAKLRKYLEKAQAFIKYKSNEAASYQVQTVRLEENEGFGETERKKLDILKHKYETLQAIVRDVEAQRNFTLIQKDTVERLSLSDMVIGHVFSVYFGYAVCGLPTIPTSEVMPLNQANHSSDFVLQPSNLQPLSSIQDAIFVDVSLTKVTQENFIPDTIPIQHFTSIKSLESVQQVTMQCMAVGEEQIGQIGALKGLFGLPNPVVLRGKNKKCEADYFIEEHFITKAEFAVKGASGSIVHTEDDAAVGMVIGHFVSLIPLCIILPVDRLIKHVETASGVVLELVPQPYQL
ncbi:hypothetical protein F5876DRAFT_77793 [Lentinula aff. lateritia]|uniref:Uncharacterized protein n=1 Tax=Lentinula aff. lateritia TaxID=2804960 RepID=A0ACC1TXA7_9AGAR|nr:hypothetical protein F5876DRAFT_77793 [Lentinula aff. lateritia]